MNTETPTAIQDLCTDFLNGLQAALVDKLIGVYLYGAWAFPDVQASGDVDFHVLLKSELSEAERAELESLHHLLAEKFPPLGAEMDGYYIVLSDARGESPPRSQMWRRAIDDAWALHRAHIHAGRCIVLYGPDPASIYPPAGWAEVQGALLGELRFVEDHLIQYPAYCILNLCRLVYSFETHDAVISKAASARWALAAFPEWSQVIEAAQKSYAGTASMDEVGLIRSKVSDFFDFTFEKMNIARSSLLN